MTTSDGITWTGSFAMCGSSYSVKLWCGPQVGGGPLVWNCSITGCVYSNYAGGILSIPVCEPFQADFVWLDSLNGGTNQCCPPGTNPSTLESLRIVFTA